MDIDNLPSDQLTCGHCGDVHPWTDYTPTALERADGDGDPRLVCAVCRRAKYARSRPISRQLGNKTDNLRRAEKRAADLWTRLQRARYERQQCYWMRSAPYSEQELARQYAEAEQAMEKHRADVAKLRQAREQGTAHRIALSRRTSRYGHAVVIPPSIETNIPCPT